MPESLDEKSLNTLKRMAGFFEEGAMTKSEAEKFLKTIMDFVLKLDRRQEQEINALKQAVQQILTKIESKFDISLTDLKGKVDSLFVGEKIEGMTKEHMAKMAATDKKLAEAEAKIKSLKNGYTPIKGRDYFDGTPGNRITASEVRDKLESLQGKEALDINKLSGIEELKEEFNKKLENVSTRRMGGGTPHNLTQVYNASSQVDGFQRTFTGLPTARHYPMAFFRGQNPVALAADIDYSIGRNSITLLNHIEPPTTGTNFYILYIR